MLPWHGMLGKGGGLLIVSQSFSARIGVIRGKGFMKLDL